ncbi:IclR family transcriptional regulator [Amycolatopsis regifaucium]|uniref:Glycerol operon regulatory protein n=1 Tax=Amycolatopsis regifaucium TaxID=546365 RepID=A0A154MPF5_9PSEU|nr:helix-turn-helix domain-containing protein [Amycolatopsis regifaucium]KZB86135.1 ArsR family transcriptional regulator [Amycolatopsis regifaucium]OKA05025.1 ArsR family transcriptional regulator [Amycolatopsis regifaucium]SFH79350.1 DNA-binding transcriptional regulator, IclR family [Amycolatopsis regifaucium]
MVSDSRKTASTSQTLSRGIRVLEVLADAQEALGVDQIAERLGVHRSIAYRLIRTLEDHGLVTRDPAGRMELGARLAALAAGIKHDLQAAALPELTTVANELGMTCFVAVLDREECVTLVSVEPRHAVASVAQRPGSRHPFTAGAPGRAVLSQLPAEEWPEDVAEEVRDVAARGYADSHGEVIENLSAVAVPLSLRGHNPAALAVVYLSSAHTPAELAERLRAAAKTVRDALGG